MKNAAFSYQDCQSCEQAFKLMLQNLHRELLKPLGFRKEGQYFRLIRNSGSISEGYLIHFQKSAYGDRDHLRFAGNLGVLWVLSSEASVLDSFKLYDCPLDHQNRLGSLAYGFDQWWEIDAETDPSLFEAEIGGLLRKTALPWMGLHEA